MKNNWYKKFYIILYRWIEIKIKFKFDLVHYKSCSMLLNQYDNLYKLVYTSCLFSMCINIHTFLITFVVIIFLHSIYASFFTIILSNWQLDHRFAFFHWDIVPIEEINIQTSLEGSTEDLGPAVESICLPSVDPVKNIEESVKS